MFREEKDLNLGGFAMTIANTVRNYLSNRGIRYEVLPHEPTSTSQQTAETSHVSGHSLAKAILLKDEKGFLLAVLPASRHIRFRELRETLERPIGLATETEAGDVFKDCALGAIPALGQAYGLDVVMDDSLAEEPVIYCEAGDHQNLLRLAGTDFQRLMQDARHGKFCA
jgi:Ala-tRNA(Pro) deacylase